MLAGRRVLITGGAGFVGSHLATRLAARNEVTILDAFADPFSRERPVPVGVRFVEGDVLDPDLTASAIAGQEIVVHLAAIVGVRAVAVDAVRTLSVGFDGTLNVLDAAARARVQRVVVSSTSELYGERANRSGEDDATPVPSPRDGRWAYAAGKLAADHLALAFHRQGRVATSIVRPFNIYGPLQAKGAIAEMITASIEGSGITVHGDGEYLRAYCYVDDLVDALEIVADAAAASGEIFNLGNPDAAVTTAELARTIKRLTGSSRPITFTPAREADIRERVPRIDKARRLLDWSPRIGLEDGIRRTLESRAVSGA